MKKNELHALVGITRLLPAPPFFAGWCYKEMINLPREMRRALRESVKAVPISTKADKAKVAALVSLVGRSESVRKEAFCYLAGYSAKKSKLPLYKNGGSNFARAARERQKSLLKCYGYVPPETAELEAGELDGIDEE